jgi:hypothetical protein
MEPSPLDGLVLITLRVIFPKKPWTVISRTILDGQQARAPLPACLAEHPESSDNRSRRYYPNQVLTVAFP